jgi:hypothetical protein
MFRHPAVDETIPWPREIKFFATTKNRNIDPLGSPQREEASGALARRERNRTGHSRGVGHA